MTITEPPDGMSSEGGIKDDWGGKDELKYRK